MFGMEQATFNSVALIFLSAGLSVLATAFWSAKKIRLAKAAAIKEAVDAKAAAIKAASDVMSDRVKDLESQLAVLTATFTPISAAFQAVLIKQLTHFHTPEMDLMLAQAAKNALSNSEEKKFREMLLERAQDLNGRIDDSEREAALMLPLVMNRVRAGAAVSDSEVMVVLVPKDKEK